MLSAWRQLRRIFTRDPKFTVLVVLTVMLGAGIATAVFTVFNHVLLRPLPVTNPEELVRVYDTQPFCAECPASFPKYVDWRERNRVFSAVGGSVAGALTMTGIGEPVKLSCSRTTASLADVYQVPPVLGRWYTGDEDQPGGRKVVVLAYQFWKQRLNADNAAVGRKLILDGEPYEITGVAPEHFSSWQRVDLFVPLQEKLDPAMRGNHFLSVSARLKKGMTIERADQEMRALGHTLAREFGNNHGISVESLPESAIGEMRTPLYVLMGAVSLLLLIGCANTANLLLISGISRRRELATKMALGAGRGSIARQLAAEGILFSALGGGLGILLAQWIVSAFAAMTDYQSMTQMQIDGRVLLFAVSVSIAAGLFCSLFPVLLLCRKELVRTIHENDGRTGRYAGKRVGNGLVIAEVALAFGLLVGSALLIKNLILLQQRDCGIKTDRVIAFDLEPSGVRYQNGAATTQLYRDIYSALVRADGVRSVGFISHLPMRRFGYNGHFRTEDGVQWDPDHTPLVEYRWMYGDYLKTVGVQLLQGRLLDERDGKGSRSVLVNKAMAEKFWPGKNPLGRRFGQGTNPWFEVVGVVGDVRSFGLMQQPPYEFYRTLDQQPFNAMTVVIRTEQEDPRTIIPAARRIINALDPALPIADVQTLEEVVAGSVLYPRLMAALTGLFGGLAGLLSMIGIYGVMAYHVRRQQHEIGVKMALGANGGRIQKTVIKHGLGLSLLGVTIGSFGVWMGSNLLKTLLQDVKPSDPAVLCGTVLLVLLVAVLASSLPARRAARIDPMTVIRSE